MNLQPGDIAFLAFWASLALSTIIALLGVIAADRRVLVVSAVLSLPFGLILSFYPNFRPAILLPLVHIAAAASLSWHVRWLAWVMLLVIMGSAVWFLLWRFLLAPESVPTP